MTVTGSVDNKQITAQQSENLNTSPTDMDPSELEDLKDRLAIRFLLKRTKRFDYWKDKKQPQPPRTGLTLDADKAAECLKYLGLAPRNIKKRDRSEQRQEERSNSQFLKPVVYECNVCTKVFFHKTLYRRHMIHHMQKEYLCMKCSQGFNSKTAKRRHDLSCR